MGENVSTIESSGIQMSAVGFRTARIPRVLGKFIGSNNRLDDTPARIRSNKLEYVGMRNKITKNSYKETNKKHSTTLCLSWKKIKSNYKTHSSLMEHSLLKYRHVSATSAKTETVEPNSAQRIMKWVSQLYLLTHTQRAYT